MDCGYEVSNKESFMKQHIKLDEEMRDDFFVSSKRKKIWNIELDLLLKLDGVCKKLDLKYFLDGGSLLGAVRHKGFIPWDDDIDVVMMREDYDKLILAGHQEFVGDYELQYVTMEPSYPGIHAKIRYKKSTAIYKDWIFSDTNQGIFIDIFPLEGIPDDETKKNALYTENVELLKAVHTYYQYDHIMSLNPRIIRMVQKRRRAIKSLIEATGGYVASFYKIEDSLRQNLPSLCNTVGRLMFMPYFNSRLILDRAFYDEAEYLEFEGYKFPCPIGSHGVLVALFGKNYMIPRRDPSFHGSPYFDPEIAYTEYIPALRREYSFINRVKRLMTGNKLSRLERNLIKM